MATPQEVVEAYLAAISTRDFERAREFLANENFTYSSPIGSFENADQFIHSLFGVGPIIEKLTVRKICSMSGAVLAIVDVLTT